MKIYLRKLGLVTVCATALSLFTVAFAGSTEALGHDLTDAPAVAARSASVGWPHAMSSLEKRQVTGYVRRTLDLTGRGGCTFRRCTFRHDTQTTYIRIRVWEDGSVRVVA